MIPIRIDKRLQHTPWVNYALIAANVLIFIFLQQRRFDLPMVRAYMLYPDQPLLYQFFSSVFMHADWPHLIGNMIFLWVFGNAVNDSFGHVGYLAFYLAGGVIAGVGYVLLSGHAPVLGASGAISAVTGAFLVLFPRVRVTVLVWLGFVLMPWEVSSLFFLMLQFVWNLFAPVYGIGGGVAYWAHSSGYIFGIAVAAALLATKLLPRDVYDLLSLLRMWRRRKTYRRSVADGYDPFRGHAMGKEPPPPPPPPGQPKRVSAQTLASKPPTGPEARELELRRQISSDHASGNFSGSAEGYLRLVQVSEDPVLPLNQQLDVSNYLMSAEQYPAAADAYGRFLRHYGGYQYIGDIRLMLGLIYSRYLHQDSLAEKHLSEAISGLFNDRKVKMAREELERVRRRLG